MHPYTHDPNAQGASVCTCGRNQHSTVHPHDFQRDPAKEPAGSATKCLCGKPLTDGLHKALT